MSRDWAASSRLASRHLTSKDGAGLPNLRFLKGLDVASISQLVIFTDRHRGRHVYTDSNANEGSVSHDATGS
jgi:hypothetical protein